MLRYVYLEKNGGKKTNRMYNTMREESSLKILRIC